jgi:hypothetical protein
VAAPTVHGWRFVLVVAPYAQLAAGSPRAGCAVVLRGIPTVDGRNGPGRPILSHGKEVRTSNKKLTACLLRCRRAQRTDFTTAAPLAVSTGCPTIRNLTTTPDASGISATFYFLPYRCLPGFLLAELPRQSTVRTNFVGCCCCPDL